MWENGTGREREKGSSYGYFHRSLKFKKKLPVVIVVVVVVVAAAAAAAVMLAPDYSGILRFSKVSKKIDLSQKSSNHDKKEVHNMFQNVRNQSFRSYHTVPVL